MFPVRRLLALATAAATLSSAACASRAGRTTTQASGGDVVGDRSLVVHVRNDNFQDMALYLVANSQARRIGQVIGNSSTRLVIPDRQIPPTGFVIVADPVGGRERASTGPLQVRGGDVLEFRIAAVPSQSSIFIR
jgi:hypothetical protein